MAPDTSVSTASRLIGRHLYRHYLVRPWGGHGIDALAVEGLQNQIIGLAGLVALEAGTGVGSAGSEEKALRDLRRSSPLLKTRFHLRQNAAEQLWMEVRLIGNKWTVRGHCVELT